MSVAIRDLKKWQKNGFCRDQCFTYKKNMSKGEFEVLIKDLYKDCCDPWYTRPKLDITIFHFDGYQGWTDPANENTCYDIFCYVKNAKHKWERHKLLRDYGFSMYNDCTK